MYAYANGRFPDSALSPIVGSGPYGVPQLRNDAAAAYLAVHRYAMRRWNISMRLDEGWVGRAYRNLQRQYLAKRTYGRNAATPGTSNHGLAIAVDLMNRQQRWVMDQVGHLFGWSKRWSDAAHEWWHLKWKPGVYKPKKRDPLWFLTPEERRKVKEYRRLKAANRDRKRRGQLWRWFITHRKSIWRAAQDSGWDKLQRRRRYRFFTELTT